MNWSIQAITKGPKHHLFGFHDLVQTNARGDLALALEVDDISRPPLPGETCRAGIVPINGSREFISVHETRAWNYPQGARQQWIGDTDLFCCNEREGDGTLVCRISDARKGAVVDTLPFPVHCLHAPSRTCVGINYDRVHACGGYGYTPLEGQICSRKIVDIPDDEGVYIGNLDTKRNTLLASLAQIAACGEKRPVRTGFPHYVTHPMLNPSGTRLAFLHRYRVPDGGEPTRLMTIGLDGSQLRCLAKGFLSHFTWLSDDELFIWGQDQRKLCALRERGIFRVPGILPCALLVKRLIRLARGQYDVRDLESRRMAEVKPHVQTKFFLRIRDVEEPVPAQTAEGVLTGDGHPMASPANRHLLVNDTYWDANGDRELMFYDVDTNVRTDLGKFRMLHDVPDSDVFDWQSTQQGLDFRIRRKFKRDDYLFYRSGLHCDLHPRWGFDGQTAFFDSIHEGTRQIYQVLPA